MKPLLPLLALALTFGPAFAENPITLRCFGETTEKFRTMPSGTVLKTTTVQGERYYELLEGEIVEHAGASTFSTKRAEIEATEDSNFRSHSGSYTITPLEIKFFELVAYKNKDLEKRPDTTIRDFVIDRQTARWTMSETFSGSSLDAIYGVQHLEKSITASGMCEPWNPKAKF